MWLKYRLLHNEYLVVIILYANLDDVMHKITCSLQYMLPYAMPGYYPGGGGGNTFSSHERKIPTQ